MGINHFPLSDEVEMIAEVDHQNKQIIVTLDAEKYPAEIHYTLDGKPITHVVVPNRHSRRLSIRRLLS